jgi:hypothetical protein
LADVDEDEDVVPEAAADDDCDFLLSFLGFIVASQVSPSHPYTMLGGIDFVEDNYSS